MDRYMFECWVIKLRNDDGGFLGDTDPVGGTWNTPKFTCYAAAVAAARKRQLDPIDHVIVRAQFQNPEILETREIDYSQSDIALAEPR